MRPVGLSERSRSIRRVVPAERCDCAAASSAVFVRSVVDALANFQGPRYLMFETLAERTLALSQLDRRRDPQSGYNPALDRFIGPVLARCLQQHIGWPR